MNSDNAGNWKNTLYFGDNLDVLKKYIPNNFADLIYIDPPFNSGATYNILFKPTSKKAAKESAQIQAFEDTWTWGEEAVATFQGIVNGTVTRDPIPSEVVSLIETLFSFLKESPMMAYLVMMTPRLVELHRVLKPTGSIYVHCDPTASHYLKLLMDGVFGPESFVNEIVWRRSHPKGLAFTRFSASHDILLRYSRGSSWTWNPQYLPLSKEYVSKSYGLVEKETGRHYQLTSLTNPNPDRPNLRYEFLGVTRVWRWTIERMQRAYEKGLIVQSSPGAVPRYKRYLDEQEGVPIGDVWIDIDPIGAQATERLGYPTQKPEALLERIISASSNPGDIVLDAFAGCGTATAVAEKLGRRWVGIDIAIPAVDVIVKRLQESTLENGHHLEEGVDFDVIGMPKDVASAEALARTYGDGWQFQYWAVTRIMGAIGSTKKTGDGGVDGTISFLDHSKPNKIGKAIISVKSNKAVAPAMVHDLYGSIVANKADFGILVTLEEPTHGMRNEALKYTPYKFNGKMDIPLVQLLSAADLFKKPLPLILPAESMVIDRKKGDSVVTVHKEELPL